MKCALFTKDASGLDDVAVAEEEAFLAITEVIDLLGGWVNMSGVRIRIGPERDLYLIEAGSIRLDGGSMFGSVPKELWQKWTPADERNRIELVTRSFLVKDKNFCLLIDGGIGHHWSPKFMQTFEVKGPTLEKSLAGFSADEITHVAVTHWHFDHVGGLVKRDPNGEITRAFSNAEIHTQLANHNVAQAPADRERASYLSETWQPYADSGQMILSHLSHSMDAEEILPGIAVQRSDGHTIGQQLVHIRGARDHFVFCADLVPTRFHLKPHFAMGYDVQPLVLEKEKKELLRQASEQKWILLFEHDPSLVAARVQTKRSERGESFELVPVDLKSMAEF